MTEVDDRPGFPSCTLPGHVHGCPGMAGGDHEYTPDERGRLARQLDEWNDRMDEIATEEDRRFEQYRDDEIAARHVGG